MLLYFNLECSLLLLDPELKVRLSDGLTINQGRVELLVNGTWGTICGDWGIKEANVVCRMLGYSEGAWSTHCCAWYGGYLFPPLPKIWLQDVQCVGDEQSIAECRHGGWGKHNCDHFDDVGVNCKYTSTPSPGSISYDLTVYKNNYKYGKGVLYLRKKK